MSGLPPNAINDIRQMAIRDAQQRVVQDHIEYVIKESGTTLRVDGMDTDAIIDGLQELQHSGYTVDETEEDYIAPLLFCHPALYDDLRDSRDEFLRFRYDDTLRCYGVECYNDATVPDGVAIMIHPTAAVPSYPSNYERPWMVRDPDGVIVFRTPDSA